MDREYTNRQKQLMRKKRKQQKRKRIFVLFCFVVCSAAILALVFKAPFFNITGVEVKGYKILKQEQILEKAEVQKGGNIFSVSMTGIKDRLLEMPYIDNAEIKRVFPNKISIEVKESVPRAYIKHGKKYVLIDKNGKILEISKKANKYKVMTINGVTLKEPETGTVIANEKDDRIKYCAEALNVLEKVKLIDKVVLLDFTQLTGIKMNYDNRVYVNCGSYESDEEFEYKLTMCEHLISEEISPYEKVEVDLTMDKTIIRPYEAPEDRKKRLAEERKQREEARKAAEEAEKTEDGEDD